MPVLACVRPSQTSFMEEKKNVTPKLGRIQKLSHMLQWWSPLPWQNPQVALGISEYRILINVSNLKCDITTVIILQKPDFSGKNVKRNSKSGIQTWDPAIMSSILRPLYQKIMLDHKGREVVMGGSNTDQVIFTIHTNIQVKDKFLTKKKRFNKMC